MKYSSMDLAALMDEKEQLEKLYADFCSRGLKLDMSRGKPAPEQLELSNGLLSAIGGNFKDESGADVRNYGNISGVLEMRDIFASMLGVKTENVVACGNSSLNAMYDTFSRAYNFGLANSEKPWREYKKIKFLCPAPGYDRHFAICEAFGAEMITVPMLPTGPDMDFVEQAVRSDETVKGIWCVPMYSNPTGVTYSDSTVARLAEMEAKAPDFTIMWDNAYCVHHLYGAQDKLANILELCTAAGHADRPLMFCSFSKITFAGGSVSCVAGSENSIAVMLKAMAAQTISYNKVDQLMHARFFGDFAGVKRHMEKHAELLRPKFEAVLRVLDEQLADPDFASWSRPRGGYFISFEAMPGTAREIVDLCGRAGVKLTEAGAAFPYHRDPGDSNIRIAPSCPTVAENEQAAELLCVCARKAAVEKLINEP